VPVGEQADEQPVEEFPLADEHAFDGGVKRLQPRSQFFDSLRGARVAHAVSM
jgi:hypothetical protein